MTEPTNSTAQPLTKQRQDGYGAHKRGEHCTDCFSNTGKVGVWVVYYSDGSKRFYCDDHVPVTPDDPPASPTPPAG